MDVNGPEPDFVGFSIEVKSPGSPDSEPLRNRLAFSYDKPVDQAVRWLPEFFLAGGAVPEISLGALPLRAEGRQLSL